MESECCANCMCLSAVVDVKLVNTINGKETTGYGYGHCRVLAEWDRWQQRRIAGQIPNLDPDDQQTYRMLVSGGNVASTGMLGFAIYNADSLKYVALRECIPHGKSGRPGGQCSMLMESRNVSD